MKTINLIVSILLTLAFNQGVLAQGPENDCEQFDLNSITYIEDDAEFDLGFDTADYLPLDFDPFKTYVNLDTITFVEDQVMVYYSLDYLPGAFNPYAYPTSFRTIDYIDPTDEFELDFDAAEYLPEGFNPYDREVETDLISL